VVGSIVGALYHKL